MSQTIQLNATKRDAHGRGASQKLRAQKIIPAVLYGHGKETMSIQLEAVPFDKVYKQAGESTLIDLMIEGSAPVKAIIHDITHDPLGTDVRHVDFYQVNMAEKIKAEVELVFEGVAPAMKELGGILIKNMTHVEIESLPGNLPHHLPVNIETLKTFDDIIRVADLKVPEGVEILNDKNDSVVLVEAPRTEEELAALNEAVVEDVASVESAKPKKEDSEEAAAADAPAPETKK